MTSINRYYSTKFNSRTDFLRSCIKCIFISHQKKDREEAKKVADYLRNAEIEVYFDEYDGDLKIHHQNGSPKEVTTAICAGINNSSHMLVLVSPNTLYSSWVPFEIGYGYDKTDLFVLCLKGIPRGKLPEYVRAVTIIRDIYDLNNLITVITGRPKEFLLATKSIKDSSDSSNPLLNAMDSVIYDPY